MQANVTEWPRKLMLFLVGDNLDLILAILEEDMPIDNEDVVTEVDSFVGVFIEANLDAVFSCKQCSEVCRTKLGLTRHKNTKHVQTDLVNPLSNLKSKLKIQSIKYQKRFCIHCILKNMSTLPPQCLPQMGPILTNLSKNLKVVKSLFMMPMNPIDLYVV